MDEKYTGWVVGALGALGVLVKVIFDALSSREKQGNDISSARISVLEKQVAELYKEHIDCQKKAVEAATELRMVKERLLEIEADRAYLRSEVARLEILVQTLQNKA